MQMTSIRPPCSPKSPPHSSSARSVQAIDSTQLPPSLPAAPQFSPKAIPTFEEDKIPGYNVPLSFRKMYKAISASQNRNPALQYMPTSMPISFPLTSSMLFTCFPPNDHIESQELYDSSRKVRYSGIFTADLSSFIGTIHFFSAGRVIYGTGNPFSPFSHGTSTFRQLGYYEGSFYMDKPHGAGKITFMLKRSFKEFKGQFYHGAIYGPGRLTRGNGTVIEDYFMSSSLIEANYLDSRHFPVRDGFVIEGINCGKKDVGILVLKNTPVQPITQLDLVLESRFPLATSKKKPLPGKVVTHKKKLKITYQLNDGSYVKDFASAQLHAQSQFVTAHFSGSL